MNFVSYQLIVGHFGHQPGRPVYKNQFCMQPTKAFVAEMSVVD